jgi:uncharacterized membrane protein/mono/diheme cytochrome c family protein
MALMLSVALLLLPHIFKLDGKPHADWQQFLGRFHPLIIHLPIGLILLVPLLEIGGRWRPALRESASLVLGLGFISSLGAMTLGYLLAYGSGDSGAGVARHMWGGIALTIGILLCLLTRPLWSSGNAPRLYPALLGCELLLLLWTAHQGGSLTHGSNYLSEYMPPQLKHWVGLGPLSGNAPVSGSFYAQHINPIFDSNCVACHGESKVDGGLRLDSYEQLMKGGKDGMVISAGAPDKSLLLVRVTLPAGHKHLMPAEGKPPLKPEEIAWIRAWVQQGASFSATSLAGVTIHEHRNVPLPPVGDYSALMPEIAAMDSAEGAKLIPVSGKASDGLILRTVDAGKSFNDTQLAQFAKFAPYIVEAELARTGVTDASLDTLSKFTHLRVLHLEDTAVTGSSLAKLLPLSQLTYLNLSGTQVTKAALTPVEGMKGLRNVYLFNTPAQPASAANAEPPIERKTL